MIVNYWLSYQKIKQLKNKNVSLLYLDSQHYLWVGTYNMGVYRCHLKRGTIDHFGIEQGLIHNSVYKIESSQGSTDNFQFIREFLENADKEIFDAIKSHIELMRERNSIKPLKIEPTPEMIAAGIPDKTIELPLVFDASTFFA